MRLHAEVIPAFIHIILDDPNAQQYENELSEMSNTASPALTQCCRSEGRLRLEISKSNSGVFSLSAVVLLGKVKSLT